MRTLSLALLLLLAAAGALAGTAAAPVKPADAIDTQDAYLPAVHIVGATGVFRTDVTIFNPSQSTVGVDLYFTPADTDGRGLSGSTIIGGVFARETVTLTDVVGVTFGKSNAYGVLNVRSTAPVIVTSNTYNVAGAVPGTYGQFSPGQPIESALGFDDSIYGDLYAPGLPNDADHRTNAVVINPSGLELEAGVQLVDAAGQIYGKRTYKVPPFSMHQINDVFGDAFAATQPPAGGAIYRLVFFVDVGNGAKILAYATVTDRRTGDPYLIPGLSLRR
ncbi:MAG TPA: hypothetical protein VKF32_15315 [Thermoanaerobaculia bacterium]|nr:hypothetical protein [Thermoanaerobaculia bacterium]